MVHTSNPSIKKGPEFEASLNSMIRAVAHTQKILLEISVA